MDGQRFDEWTRALAGVASRRRILAGLAAGLAAFGPRRAAAQGCSPYGRVCTTSRCCTAGTCRCYPNGHCRCVCPAGTSFDDGACVTTGGCPVQIVAGPPAQAVFTFQDSATGGLAEILVTRSENADTVVPPFTVGTSNPVVVTSTKIDQSQPARIEIRVTTVQGAVKFCDVTF